MMTHSTTISFQEWLKDHNGDISQLLFDWGWSLSASQYTRVPAPTYATTVAELDSTSFSVPLATDADEAQVNGQTCTYDYMGRRARSFEYNKSIYDKFWKDTLGFKVIEEKKDKIIYQRQVYFDSPIKIYFEDGIYRSAWDGFFYDDGVIYSALWDKAKPFKL